jgi:hypothetical protein
MEPKHVLSRTHIYLLSYRYHYCFLLHWNNSENQCIVILIHMGLVAGQVGWTGWVVGQVWAGDEPQGRCPILPNHVAVQSNSVDLTEACCLLHRLDGTMNMVNATWTLLTSVLAIFM